MKKGIVMAAVLMCILPAVFAGGTKETPAQTKAETASSVATASASTVPGATAPKYIFYMIGDGLGSAQRQIAEYYLQHKTGNKNAKLLMDTLPVAGINTTYSEDSLVTDSAAAATALAGGVKTNNGMISVLPDGKTVSTLVEAAEKKGMGTGLVTTTRITHATPACFASHNPDRDDENGIAADYLDSGVDFFAGGGIRHFISNTDPEKYGTTDAVGAKIKSKRKDGVDVVAKFSDEGYKTFIGSKGVDAFKAYEPQGKEQVLALFTYTHCPYEIDLENQHYACPSLPDMTKKAIDVLSKYENGFFLMVEGGRIDHACHANDAAGAIYDTFAFDDSIKLAYEFYKQHPHETAIIVIGDHETGGMGLGFGENYFLNLTALDNVKVSVEDVLQYQYKKGEHEAFFQYLAQNFGLPDLTAEEKTLIETAMEREDEGFKAPEGYDYNQAAIAATHVISTRTNMYWTTYAHSGTSIPMSAIGDGVEAMGGFKDNTEIAKAASKYCDLPLNQ